MESFERRLGRYNTAPIPSEMEPLLGGPRQPSTFRCGLSETIHHLILPGGEEWRPPILTRRASMTAPGRSFAFTTMMMVNAIVGSGILSLPYAFVKGGLLLSTLFLFAISALAYVTATWIVETQSRAQALAELTTKGMKAFEELGQNLSFPASGIQACTEELHFKSRGEVLDETIEAVKVAQGRGRGALTLPPLPSDFEILSNRVFELNELCHLFLGRAGQRAYEASLFFYTYSTMWLYATIMANTIVSVVPIPTLTHFLECDVYSNYFPAQCDTAYRFWLCALCLFLLPICFMEIYTVARIQLFFNVLGYTCIATMTISVALAIFVVPAAGVHSTDSPPYLAQGTLFDTGGFGIVFATTIFTQMCHWGIPSITQALGDKHRVKGVMLTTFSLTFSLYLLVGILCCMYFGNTVMPTITLNFRHFTLLPDGSRPFWVQAISTLVMVVPVFTIICCIPIFVHTLGNNIVSSMSPETWRKLLRLSHYQGVWPPPMLTVAARIFTLVPPFVLAFFEKDASTIVAFCGLFGFALMFFIPDLLQWHSIRVMQALWPNSSKVWKTPYSSAASSLTSVVAVFFFAIIAFAFNVNTVLRKMFS